MVRNWGLEVTVQICNTSLTHTLRVDKTCDEVLPVSKYAFEVGPAMWAIVQSGTPQVQLQSMHSDMPKFATALANALCVACEYSDMRARYLTAFLLADFTDVGHFDNEIMGYHVAVDEDASKATLVMHNHPTTPVVVSCEEERQDLSRQTLRQHWETNEADPINVRDIPRWHRCLRDNTND